MKLRRALLLALALTLLLTCAQAEGWREGLSAAKPYEGVPEVDLQQQLGYIVYNPMNSTEARHSCQRLYIYLPRKDVKAGEGRVTLYSAEDEALWRAAMNEVNVVKQRDMTDAELNSVLWAEGTCFEIKLPRSLVLGQTYYMNMEQGCIVSDDGKVSNPAMDGKYAWRFSVTGDYGASSMEYRRPIAAETPKPTATPTPTATPDPAITPDPSATATVDPELEALIALANGVTPEPTATPEVEYEIQEKPEPGDQIHFELTLGGEATEAVIYGYNSSVNFPLVRFEESCEVFGEVLLEDPAWGIMFLDKDGNELERAEFR